MSATVYVVHCIDTEGPLHESIQATFERISGIFGIDLPPSAETLHQLQNGEIDLGGLEAEIARVVAPDLLDYNDTWHKIDAMLDRVMAQDFRDRTPDSAGKGWVYNWFCVDHVGYTSNPRDRDMGYFSIHDHYRGRLAENPSSQDGLYFHFHPLSLRGAGNHAATRYFNDGGRLYDILARYIIERLWFPSAYRPGFHSERPDAHWFLEQFIPFDFANQATRTDRDGLQRDISGGRFGDWRRAPLNWRPYHPAHDDHQKPGNCRRWIFRCLNVGTRLRLLEQDDVDAAFLEAQSTNSPVVLSFANHDYRDIGPDVTRVMDMLSSSAKRFSDVPYLYADARTAARQTTQTQANSDLALDLKVDPEGLVTIKATAPTFGPQPFLALKDKDGAYHSDNLDIHTPFRTWSYTLDDQTLPLDQVEKIGVAACDAAGTVTVTVYDVACGDVKSVTF